MTSQKFFSYYFKVQKDEENFFVNSTNQNAYDISILNNFDENIYLYGPKKSGKSHLLNIWANKNNAIIFNDNFPVILNSYQNVAIDDCLKSINEEKLFHIINHCNLFRLKMFLTSSFDLKNTKFELKDLQSRLRSFYYIDIKSPDDEMCKMLMTKLFSEKQIIIKNKEIFNYIFNRVPRSYYDIINLVQKLDKFSLEKKRQLTIPLIKEII